MTPEKVHHEDSSHETEDKRKVRKTIGSQEIKQLGNSSSRKKENAGKKIIKEFQENFLELNNVNC